VCFCFDFDFSKNSGLQGFPCIGYIFLMFQLQGLKGCCDTL
jgi:hypothetical protein